MEFTGSARCVSLSASNVFHCIIYANILYCMMFADDTKIYVESGEQVEENLQRWRCVLECRRMKVRSDAKGR